MNTRNDRSLAHITRGEIFEQLDKSSRGHGIKAGGWFIQDQHIGRANELDPNRDPPHLPARDPTVLYGANANVRDMLQASWESTVWARCSLM